MKRMRISASILAVLVSAMVCVICSKAGIAYAAIESEVTKTLNLE
jgi:succinate dehydrogenase hydrophobic anchor subunit